MKTLVTCTFFLGIAAVSMAQTLNQTTASLTVTHMNTFEPMDVIEVSELQVEFDMVFEKLTMLEKLLYKKDELSEKQQGHLIEERSAIYF